MLLVVYADCCCCCCCFACFVDCDAGTADFAVPAICVNCKKKQELLLGWLIRRILNYVVFHNHGVSQQLQLKRQLLLCLVSSLIVVGNVFAPAVCELKMYPHFHDTRL